MTSNKFQMIDPIKILAPIESVFFFVRFENLNLKLESKIDLEIGG